MASSRVVAGAATLLGRRAAASTAATSSVAFAPSFARPRLAPLLLGRSAAMRGLRAPTAAAALRGSRRPYVSHHGPNPRLPSSSSSSSSSQGRGGGGGSGGKQQYNKQQHFSPKGRPPLPLYIKVTGVIVGTGFVCYFGSYEQAPYTGRWRPMPVSRATELELGEASNRAMLAKFQGRVLPPDHKTARLLRKVGRKLAAAAGCEDLPWEFHVIDADEIMNAAAMPGGKVVVFTGLRQCVTTEEELAAVIGHEISHVVLRHSAEQMAKAAAMNYLFLLLALLGLPVNELTLLLGDLAIQKPNSRVHELEADEVGVLLCAQAGYDPAAAIRVFQRMEKVEAAATGGLRVPGFLSTHPAFPDRIASLQLKVAKVRPVYEQARASQGLGGGWGSGGGFVGGA